MTFILDMSSGKEYPGEALSCPNQRTSKTLLPDAARDSACPSLQLATASVNQPASPPSGATIDAALESLED